MDFKRLIETTWGNRQLLHEVLHAFLQQAEIEIADLEAALQAGNRASVVATAHSMISTLGSVDADEPLLRLLPELENAAKDGHTDLSPLAGKVLAGYREIVAGVEGELGL